LEPHKTGLSWQGAAVHTLILRQTQQSGKSAIHLLAQAEVLSGPPPVTEERQPSFLLDNALLVTGEVDRTTAFERGMPGQQEV
jgi:7,8-dihydropterin-6-yl-methyl-4-(beta-D-ribofuranosyl)aminobenzene 5'-phosphate synthase